MTISLADVQNAIRQAVIDTSAVPSATAVAWVDEQQPSAKTLIKLDLVYLQHLQDREENDVDTGEWVLSSSFYIRVQARAESIYNAPGYDASFALEKVRAGLLRPDIVLGAGIVYQPDISTYVHHLSYLWDGRMISAYALEMGFRAVIDYPLTGTVDSLSNMQAVELDDGEAEVGEDDPVLFEGLIERP